MAPSAASGPCRQQVKSGKWKSIGVQSNGRGTTVDQSHQRNIPPWSHSCQWAHCDRTSYLYILTYQFLQLWRCPGKPEKPAEMTLYENLSVDRLYKKTASRVDVLIPHLFYGEVCLIESIHWPATSSWRLWGSFALLPKSLPRDGLDLQQFWSRKSFACFALWQLVQLRQLRQSY